MGIKLDYRCRDDWDRRPPHRPRHARPPAGVRAARRLARAAAGLMAPAAALYAALALYGSTA